MPCGAASASAAQKLGGIICETAASERVVHPERDRGSNGDHHVVGRFPVGEISAPGGNSNH